MKKRLLCRYSWIVFLVLCVQLPVKGQEFQVLSSDPAPGSANVPLSTTVTFEFGLPSNTGWGVSQTTDWNTAFRALPQDGVVVSSPQLLLNEGGRPAVVTYSATHEAGVDVSWLVYDVQAEQTAGGTQAMSEPYVLRYTTAATIGSYEIAGQVQEGGAIARLSGQAREQLQELAAHVRVPSAEASKHAQAWELDASAEQDFTLIYLVGAFTSLPSKWDVQAATVIAAPTGSYTLDYIRDGTYWPLVVRFLDKYHTEIEALGFYDADGDTYPDSVRVEGGSLQAIDLTVHTYEATPALSKLEQARQLAGEHLEDTSLLRIRSGEHVISGGVAYTWHFDFYSEQQDQFITVTIDPLVETVRDDVYYDELVGQPPLPDQSVDTDQAVQVALDDGGNDFLAGYVPTQVRTIIESKHVMEGGNSDAVTAAWHIRFVGTNRRGISIFERLIDMQDGSLIVTAKEPTENVADFSLEVQSYPNPIYSNAIISFTLPEASPVHIDVFNSLGARVASLANGEVMPRGEHEVTWEPISLASGVYWCRVRTPSRVAHRALVIQK